MTESTLTQYETGGETLAAAIRGLSPAELMAAPIPGKWSTHQVVVHLADAEIAFADRIQRVIAHDEPKLLPWDEKKYAARLHYRIPIHGRCLGSDPRAAPRTGKLLAKHLPDPISPAPESMRNAVAKPSPTSLDSQTSTLNIT